MPIKRSPIKRKKPKPKTPKRRVSKTRILPEDEIVDALTTIFKARRSDAFQAVRTAMSRGASLDDMKAALKTTLDRHAVRPFERPVGFWVTEAANIVAGTPSPPLEKAADPLEVAASWRGLVGERGTPSTSMRSIADVLGGPKIEPVPVESPAEGEGPRCPTCDDAGYLRKDLPRDHPDFGKVIPCGCMRETLEERVAKVREWSGLTPLQLEMRLKGTKLVDGMKEAIDACVALIKGDITQIVFQSPPGRGKTRLAVATLNEHLDKGVKGLYVNVARFLEELRNTYDRETPETYTQVIRPAQTWPLVVLDDLGGEKPSAWTVQTLYEIIDARYQAGLKTIACTNADPYRMDDRIVSRLCDVTRGVVITFGKAADYRLTGTRA